MIYEIFLYEKRNKNIETIISKKAVIVEKIFTKIPETNKNEAVRNK